MLLDHLEKEKVTAAFFVTGLNKTDEKGRELLKSWNDKGHRIANHTLTHPNYNSKHNTFEKFSREVLQTDSIIREYSNYMPRFRFPYLKAGDTPEKVERFREFLRLQGYKHGYVTIDASDWYINSRLIKRLKEDSKADISDFRNFYLEHLFERAAFYEKLAFELTGRHIKHTLLLHHNLAAALFLGDLMSMFKEKGWKIISADKAFEDEVFDLEPPHAGESIIWGLAKDSGKYDDILRYPAEDSRYEEERMNELGL